MASANEPSKKKLLKVLLRVISIVRVRESRLRIICDTVWIQQLKYLPVNVMMKKFKYVLGNSSLKTLFQLYKKNLFKDNEVIARFLTRIIERRDLEASPYAAEILQGMKKNAHE